jgi:hypothetical protein
VKVTLDFCRWLHANYDQLLSEAARQELIEQAHEDAAAERAMGSPEKRKHKVFPGKAFAVGGTEPLK